MYVMQRKMGIDYGDKRIGIAMTDALCIISSPFEVYQNKGVEDAIEHIATLVKDYNVSRSLLDRLKHNKPLSTVTIDDLCRILRCNVDDIMIYIEAK